MLCGFCQRGVHLYMGKEALTAFSTTNAALCLAWWHKAPSHYADATYSYICCNSIEGAHRHLLHMQQHSYDHQDKTGHSLTGVFHHNSLQYVAQQPAQALLCKGTNAYS